MAAALFELAACSSSDTSDAMLPSATYGFGATVRTGTSQGTSYQGDLVLVQSVDANHGEGVMYIPAAGSTPAQTIPVSAVVAAGNISLTFTMADGRVINGVGPFSGAVSDTASAVQGSLTGPAADDKGDWAGTGRPCTTYQRKLCTDGITKCVQYSQYRGPCPYQNTDFGNILSNREPTCRTCVQTQLIIPECRCTL